MPGHMLVDDDEVFKSGEEERPGPADLESALPLETLDQVATQPPLVVATCPWSTSRDVRPQ